MPHTEWLIPRPVLFNAALYALAAIIYTVTLFALEVIRPGDYVFSDNPPASGPSWRTRFSYLAICSWPILLFGALILIAVRIGARSRKRKNRGKGKRQDKGKSKSKKRVPPSTLPPGVSPTVNHDPAGLNIRPPSPIALPPKPPTTGALLQPQYSTDDGGAALARAKSSGRSRRTRSGRKQSVPRGYVSVTRPQRIFASFGFLWVAVGLACTAASGALVFVGQRERYKETYISLNKDGGWKSWVIPLITGGLPLLVYAIMAVTTFIKFVTTLIPKNGRVVNTPATSVDYNAEAADGTGVPEPVGVADVEFGAPEGYMGLPPVGYPGGGGRREDAGLGAGYRPDEAVVERMMRQLRDMGFKNAHENVAALEASSFDLEIASEKLANARS